MSPERTALYRLYGDADELFYIGVAKDILMRWKRHAYQKSWWPQVLKMTVEWHDSREEAERAEEAAIRAEHPKYNVPYSPLPSPLTPDEVSKINERKAQLGLPLIRP